MRQEAPSPAPASAWLAHFAERLMEGAWLGVAAVMPLFFDPNALEGFEPVKAEMLRIAAVVIGAAWLLRIGALRSSGLQAVSKQLTLVLSLLAAANLLATAFSISPSESFWGAHEYRQGVVTTLAGMLICLALIVHLRTRAQAQRLITAIILVSVPMALYALVQAAGLDLKNFTSEGRVASFAGHPIYLASYLVMVLPLTLWRSAQSRGLARGDDAGRRPGTALYAGIALLQMAAFFAAGSRGPLFGLGTALAILGLGWTTLTQRWKVLRAGAAAALLPLGFFIVLNLHFGPALRLASTLGIARFANTLNLHTSDGFRVRHWQEAARFLFAPIPVQYPEGGADPWPGTRRVFGYGPETLPHVLPQRLTWPSQEINVEDRFHNHLWDLWYSLGFCGVTAFLALIVHLAHRASGVAGLLERASPRVWAGTLAANTVAGGVAALFVGPGFLPLGLIGGLAMALIFWPLLHHWRWPGGPVETNRRPLAFLALALLAGLAGDLVANSFAFPTALTLLHFWLYAGLIAALERGFAPPLAIDLPPSRPNRSAKPEPTTPGSGLPDLLYLASLILITVLFAFIHEYSAQTQTISGLLTKGEQKRDNPPLQPSALSAFNCAVAM